MARQQQETPAKKPAAPKPRKTPVDTVALKNTIARNDGRAKLDVGIAATAKRGSAEESRFTQSATRSSVAAGRGRATLDSARAGQIPARPSRIKRAMTGGMTSVVDRIEGNTAVLEDTRRGKSTMRDAPADSLQDPAEGRVYREGTAAPDTAEERRRRGIAGKKMDALRDATEPLSTMNTQMRKKPPAATKKVMDSRGQLTAAPEPGREYSPEGRLKPRSFKQGVAAVKKDSGRILQAMMGGRKFMRPPR